MIDYALKMEPELTASMYAHMMYQEKYVNKLFNNWFIFLTTVAGFKDGCLQFYFIYIFEKEPHVTQVGLNIAVNLRLVLNSESHVSTFQVLGLQVLSQFKKKSNKNNKIKQTKNWLTAL